MKSKISTTIFRIFILCIALCLPVASAFCQKWSGVNGNEWLQGKYAQKWVRIGVNAKGIHKISINTLPADFQTADKSKLQLWHRGNEVSLIKADANEILFYGVPNDGASDSLLYRLPSTRKNPYFSTFSDESAYFLTIGTSNGARAVVENTAIDNAIPALDYHVRTELRTYQNEYTHTSIYSPRPTTLNSYFEEGKTATGSRMPISNNLSATHTSNPKSISYTNTYVPEPFTFNIKNLQNGTVPNVKMLLSGRYGNAHPEIYVGKTPATLRLVTTVSTSDFMPLEVTFPLNPDDYDANGGTFGFKATAAQNYFSVSYFAITYSQKVDMQGLNTYEFNFPAVSANTKSRIVITTPAASSTFYDISKVDQPRIIAGSASALMVTRDDAPLKLLATNETKLVTNEKISLVEFKQPVPASFDYLIVTNQALESAAKTFATYRESESPGKKYKPIVKQIREIYNEFNYGEPSPVAIRRFVDYMISDNNKDKYLLLIGKSVTRPDRATKELNEEVPTVGFPGSDILLVDGLNGTPNDVPAIPVGRISAITPKHVTDYLDKIKTYESQQDLSWRSNVMHLSGGTDQNEINQFSGYLSAIGNNVTKAPFQGVVLKKVKSIPQDVQEQITISTELNGQGSIKGLGMVSYFGHGTTYRTDLNAGYVSDGAKGYNNPGKYPVLFYNGCSVGNVFSGNFAETVNQSSSRPMSLDWLLAPAKGAIVVLGNSWDSYASVSNEFLSRLYPLIFSKTDAQRGTIGQILKEVAVQTKADKGYTYTIAQNGRVASYYDADRANIHQMLLQGDPALRILIKESALPVELTSFDAKANGTDKVDITWRTASEKNNSHFIIERSYNARNFESIGRVEGKGDSNSEYAYSFTDSDPLDGTSYYRLTQVDLDEVIGGQTQPGISTTSSIVSVSRNHTSSLSVSPNPATDFVDIQLKAPVAIKSWNLINANGKVLRRNEVGKRVSLVNLSAGEYLIEIFTVNGDKYTKKVIKY
jgi:hypothetical protein